MGFASDDLKIGYTIQAKYKGNIFKHRNASILIPYIFILYLFNEKFNWITASNRKPLRGFITGRSAVLEISFWFYSLQN